MRKKKYHGWVKKRLMWHIIIIFKPEYTHKHKFKSYTDNLNFFPQLKQVYKLDQKFIICFLVRFMNKDIIDKYQYWENS